MATQLTDEARIERMLAEGKLTSEEAQRLRGSLDARRGQDDAIRRAAAIPAPERRRLGLLLAFLAAFFLLGAGTQWLVSEVSGGGDAPLETSESMPSAQPEGRVIDLSSLPEERSQTMNRVSGLSLFAVVIGVLAVLGALLMFIYNGLVGTREQVNAGWAQVENVYQRRLDLVPLLVDAVQTYTEHERETLAELTKARANAMRASGTLGGQVPDTVDQLKAIEASQGAVGSALARLFAVVESYPELKASQNFLALQDQIEGTENRVAIERRNYNEFSRRYNTRLQTFPSNIVAEMLGFQSKPYFEAEPKALKGLADPFGRRQG
jgi:LemA protein